MSPEGLLWRGASRLWGTHRRPSGFGGQAPFLDKRGVRTVVEGLPAMSPVGLWDSNCV
jgi:hypothetical protein